jgi:YfiH family protein
LENRKQLAQSLENTYQRPLSFIVANQTHSSNIEVIQEAKNKGWESSQDAIKNCDALITNSPHLVLTILTADCVPILLYDPNTQTIAIIHAGWKGTDKQITSKTIKKMQEIFHSKPEDIVASIAPSIGKCCYEVGEDVGKYFKKYPQSYKRKANKYMLDLPYLNQKQLIEAGVKSTNIELSNICTSCEVERFFSYRKEKGCSGRFMSMIALCE